MPLGTGEREGRGRERERREGGREGETERGEMESYREEGAKETNRLKVLGTLGIVELPPVVKETGLASARIQV